MDDDALRALVRAHGRRVTRLVLFAGGVILLLGLGTGLVVAVAPADGSEKIPPALVVLAVGHPGLILLLFALLNHRLYRAAVARGRFLPVRIEGAATTDEISAAALPIVPLLMLGSIAPIRRVVWSSPEIRAGRTVLARAFSDELPWLDAEGRGRVLSSRILGLPFLHLVFRRRGE